jgi:hypothetical protein
MGQDCRGRIYVVELKGWYQKEMRVANEKVESFWILPLCEMKSCQDILPDA